MYVECIYIYIQCIYIYIYIYLYMQQKDWLMIVDKPIPSSEGFHEDGNVVNSSPQGDRARGRTGWSYRPAETWPRLCLWFVFIVTRNLYFDHFIIFTLSFASLIYRHWVGPYSPITLADRKGLWKIESVVQLVDEVNTYVYCVIVADDVL
jgi:hypothetical protein